MRKPATSIDNPRSSEHARDLQAKLYREIGISAVAAALRFTNQPEPAQRPSVHSAADRVGKSAVAA